MDSQGLNYGASAMLAKAGPKTPQNLKAKLNVSVSIDNITAGRFVKPLVSVFLPYLLFYLVFAVLSFKIHFQDETSTYTLVVIAYLIPSLMVIRAGYLHLCVIFGYESQETHILGMAGFDNKAWLAFLGTTGIVACVIASLLGQYNYMLNMEPYYKVSILNHYSSVDPNGYTGQQVMDAGIITFTDHATIDRSRSMGFRNRHTYCVAPIISDTNKTSNSYDFWAVGLDCCRGTEHYNCQEYSNGHAHSGLRVVSSDTEEYFRLAVEQATASYNVVSNHPIFLYWMQDPGQEIDQYKNDGEEYFQFVMVIYFIFQLLTAAFMAATWDRFFSRLSIQEIVKLMC